MTRGSVSTEDRALELLSVGTPQELVASACGVSPSRISQLLSDPDFSTRLSEKKFTNLTVQTDRDKRLDTLEDKLIEKVTDLSDMIIRPMEAVRALSMVNALKRRGPGSPDLANVQANIVSLTLPVKITNTFIVGSNNQVVETKTEEGRKSLVTIQSHRMDSLLADRQAAMAAQLAPPTSPENKDKLRAMSLLLQAKRESNETNTTPEFATVSSSG